MDEVEKTSSTCRAAIVWLRDSAGGNMPVNADTVREDDYHFHPGRHVSHFSICQQATAHRQAPGCRPSQR